VLMLWGKVGDKYACGGARHRQGTEGGPHTTTQKSASGPNEQRPPPKEQPPKDTNSISKEPPTSQRTLTRGRDEREPEARAMQ
jgi:hypothetical protein